MASNSEMYLRGESEKYFNYLEKMSSREYRMKIKDEIDKTFNLIRGCGNNVKITSKTRRGIFVRTIGAVKSPSGVRFGLLLEDGMKEFEWKVGNGSVPIWLDQQIRMGRVKLNYNEETSKLESLKIFSPTGSSVAEAGDSIILSRSGLSVLKKRVWQEPEEEPRKRKVEVDEENSD